ncbi:MAG TPA: hypothetical protein DDW94_03865 [Deltaproteobacteria bacterium]|nr:MAG: hypothetical protein A2Z79_10915 [Deltaproteobacteria bacterium GWA2_55_82]HBG46107.1 hypothetical protein [Deltaproteobacteria bacterium]HCY11605.1 hypothetical protein [Deltaproteobacteria bacterium]
MYSSKIIKNTSVRISPEPFSLPAHGHSHGHAGSKDHEGVGSGIEAIEKEAYEKGFMAGEKAGFEFGARKADVYFSGLEGIIQELASFRESLFSACENEMAVLSLAIAKKVVQREVEIKEDGVLDCVRTALKAVVAGGEIAIRVNPREIEVVSRNRPELLKYCGGARGLSVEPDELVSRGGCVISTNFGEIDSTITSIMSEIEEKLADAYSRP